MISYADALAAILDRVPRRPSATMPVTRARGLALVRPLRATMQWPRRDESAMDGFAVRAEDATGEARLRVLGEMPAGTERRLSVRSGTAVKVFTGSPLPTGADAVAMREVCAVGDGHVVVGAALRPGAHVRRAGEEFRRGDELLPAGSPVTPAVVGLLALLGVTEVRVHEPPRVGVITMGDELVGEDQPVGRASIRDANGPAIAAALAEVGVTRVRRWRVSDDAQRLTRALRAAVQRCDVVITVGGASVGDHDHVTAAREAVGVATVFDRVAIRPGKPNHFGLASGGEPVFSLPGNPVSALVSFRLLVRPALRAMLGLAPFASAPVPAELAAPVTGDPRRRQWVRGSLEAAPAPGQPWRVRPLPAQGSHMLAGLAAAELLIEVPPKNAGLQAGDAVLVHPIAG